MNNKTVEAVLLERQRLVQPAGVEEYEELLRGFSPLRTVYWTCPGSPPCLPHRADFDDAAHCQSLRAVRRLIKGRFFDSSVAYILADELPLFAGAYRNTSPVTFGEGQILELLDREGPMNIGLMKQMTGLLSKQITPLLHKLQEKFLVFEDQADSEWDRAWYPFAAEFPDVDLTRYTKGEAIQELVMRMAWYHVAVTPQMVRDFYRFSLKEAQIALNALEAEGRLIQTDGQWVRAEDLPRLEREETPPRCVFALNRNDPLVKANESELKKRFPRGESDVLYYLLVDGEFLGTVRGRFRNGPFELEDVELPAETAKSRRQEVLLAVRAVADPAVSPLKRYLGKALL